MKLKPLHCLYKHLFFGSTLENPKSVKKADKFLCVSCLEPISLNCSALVYHISSNKCSSSNEPNICLPPEPKI